MFVEIYMMYDYEMETKLDNRKNAQPQIWTSVCKN